MTESNVAPIRAANPDVNQALIEILEDLLRDAKSGVLQTISFVGERTGGEIISGRTRFNSIPQHVWGLELLKFRILQACEDSDE